MTPRPDESATRNRSNLLAILVGWLLASAISAAELADIAAVTAGVGHSCARSVSGVLWCWGRNTEGQIGDGTPAQRWAAVPLADLPDPTTSVSAGGRHTCAVTTAGTARCWGENTSGQLGDNSTTLRLKPTAVAGLSSGVRSVSAGYDYTCALLLAGNVVCWGSNQYGQLGDGSTTMRSTPADVVGLGNDVVAISAGLAHACAVLATSELKCWGGNAFGQLGNGTSGALSPPVFVTGLGARVAQVSAGGGHTCALTGEGAVKCWGLNQNGQLGDGSNTGRQRPVDAAGLGSAVISIATGRDHSCAVAASGQAFCWGSNASGQLGNDTVGFTDFRLPLGVIGLGRATGIVAGTSHTCAVTLERGVKCWGLNDYGQLGENGAGARPTPARTRGLEGGAVAIAAGPAHTCALRSAGDVWCWGSNSSGQLGNNSSHEWSVPIPTQGLPPGVRAIGAGNTFTCALTGAGGVKCWGNNFYGTLGDSTTTFRYLPVDVVGLASGVAAIAVGDSFVCALTGTGGVKCWGANGTGALGDGTTTQRNAPVDVAGLQQGVAAIATGQSHACALTMTGALMCWGDDSAGALGDGGSGVRLTPVEVIGGGVAAIAAGGNQTCARMNTGEVRCWGDNRYGQLGIGSTANPATGTIAGLGPAPTALALDLRHGCAVLDTGRIKCWGANESGQLGVNDTTRRLAPVNVVGIAEEATAVATGWTHTCALTRTGAAWCWGSNTYGQLGDGTAGMERLPVTVTRLPAPIVAEFYNATLDNYFITANADEGYAIELGAAGPGWIRTGESFSSGGDVPVCRFYGSMSPGPNSHFYALDGAECQALKAQQFSPGDPRRLTEKSWNFESLDFRSTRPQAGACAAGMVPVYRAYNNGYARGIDSNHRIGSNPAAIAQVTTRGWIAEGVVMCAPE